MSFGPSSYDGTFGGVLKEGYTDPLSQIPPDRQVTNILLVDDHLPNLVALEAILEPLGQRLVRASSGEEALRRLLQEDFSVILMDVQMPGLDGIETGALIKSRKRTRDVPIIFLTAINKDPEHIFRGYKHGAVDYLLKPFHPEILRAKVGVFVDLYVQREQIRIQEARLRQRERAALERENEQRYRRLIEAMPSCVWEAGPDGRIRYANQVARDYGAAPEGAALADLESIHPDDRESVRDAWHATSEGRATELHFRLRHQALDAYRWHLGRAVAERDGHGKITGWIATATDIDDQRRAEEALSQLLLREQEARQEAEAANRAKDEFLATVSHELRTPLTAIVGWIGMLRKGQLGAEKVERALETIERNAKVQAQLIEDILDVSRIITGKLHLELMPLDLAAVLEDAVDAVRPAAQAKGVDLVIELGTPCAGFSGDAPRLQQVAWNLLMNAIKFTPKGGLVTLRITQVESHVEMTVSDTGKGISPDFLPYVFDRFRQADGSSRRQHGGLGLGLAIVRHLVELHGGSVGVESAGEGQGATFTVALPIRAIHVPAGAPSFDDSDSIPVPAPEDAVRLDGIKVLIVDDEEDARELLAMVLQQQGATALTVASAAEALAALEQFRPDVLMSDIGLPNEDGYALIERVRALTPERGGQVPAAALTAYASHRDRKKVLQAGFQMHLTKPVEPTDLAASVASLAGRASPVC